MTQPIPPTSEYLAAMFRSDMETAATALTSMGESFWAFLQAADSTVRDAAVDAFCAQGSGGPESLLLAAAMKSDPAMVYQTLASRPIKFMHVMMASQVAATSLTEKHVPFLNAISAYYKALPDASKHGTCEHHSPAEQAQPATPPQTAPVPAAPIENDVERKKKMEAARLKIAAKYNVDPSEVIIISEQDYDI